MTEVIFTLFENYKNKPWRKKRRFSEILKLLLVRRVDPVNETVIEIGENRLIIACLPLPEEDAGGKRIKKFLTSIKTLKDRHPEGTIFAPKDFSEKIAECAGVKKVQRSTDIMKAILPDILDFFCVKNRVKTSDLKIVMLPGENTGELFELIRYIAPVSMYVTAVVSDKESSIGYADDIYEEFGLPVVLSQDIKNALRGADIIISLKNKESFGANLRVRPKTVIVDILGNAAMSCIDGGVAVKGLEVTIPEEIGKAIPHEAIKTYGGVVFAETVSVMKAGFIPGNKLLRAEELEGLREAFFESGFRLQGLLGRHNVIEVLNKKTDSRAEHIAR